MKLLTKLNGWQRLWILASLGILLYFSVLKPLDDASIQQAAQLRLYADAYGDFREPNCLRYQTERFSSLPSLNPEAAFEPGSCSHIWLTRKTSANPDNPYTEKHFLTEMQSRVENAYRQSFFYGSIIAIVLSILLYVAGVLIAWVVQGFKSST